MVYITETLFLVVSYEILEKVVDSVALQQLPEDILEDSCVDFSALKIYESVKSVADAKIYIFRKFIAIPRSILNLPFTQKELMSLCLRYLAILEDDSIIYWRIFERLQGICLFYLISSMESVDELLPGVGLGRGPHPAALRWIVIDYFIYPTHLKPMGSVFTYKIRDIL